MTFPVRDSNPGLLRAPVPRGGAGWRAPGAPRLVGGRAAPSYSHILKRIDAIELNILSDLRPHLHELQLAETRR